MSDEHYNNSIYAENVANNNLMYKSANNINPNFKNYDKFKDRQDRKNLPYIYRKMKRTAMMDDYDKTNNKDIFMEYLKFDKEFWDSITEEEYNNFVDPFDFKDGVYKIEDIKKHKGIEFIDFSNELTKSSLKNKNILFVGDVHGDISIIMNIIKHYYYSKIQKDENFFKNVDGDPIKLDDSDFNVELYDNLDYSKDENRGKGAFRDFMINNGLNQRSLNIFKNIILNNQDKIKKSIYSRLNFEEIIKKSVDYNNNI